MHDALVALRDVHDDGRSNSAGPRAGSASCLRPKPCAICRRATVIVADAARARRRGRQVAADVVVVPVLRAGLGMLDAVLELVPGARVGHIGLQRDETTAVASQYYAKLPGGLDASYVLMIDPMLATGGSAVSGLERADRGRRRDHPHRSASSPRPKGSRW